MYVEGIFSQFEFFNLLEDLKKPADATSDDIIAQLQSMVSQRDNARRQNNPLLKPLSEIDLAHFSRVDNVTPSYYRLPDEFPMPLCSGRYTDAISRANLNDAYCSITHGSENFKFKQKNVHEDLLFKNEDDMYSIDHVILQLQTVVKNLEKEQVHAQEWDALVPELKEATPYKPKFLSRVTLSFIDQLYKKEADLNKNIKVTDKLYQKDPKLVIQTFLYRLQIKLEDVKAEKGLKLDDWRLCCQINFDKSLDYRSFYFKEAQKKQLIARKQVDELCKISHLKDKNTN